MIMRCFYGNFTDLHPLDEDNDSKVMTDYWNIALKN